MKCLLNLIDTAMSLLAGQKELCKSNSVIVFDCALLTLYFSENIGNHFHWWNRWETMSQSNETVDSENSMQITVESSKCLSPYNVSAFFFFFFLKVTWKQIFGGYHIFLIIESQWRKKTNICSKRKTLVKKWRDVQPVLWTSGMVVQVFVCLQVSFPPWQSTRANVSCQSATVPVINSKYKCISG